MSVLFEPVRIGRVEMKNRLILAPMQQHQGTQEGFATEYHINHYSSIAKSGVGLIIVESTSVAEDGRLFQDDIGIFSNAHIQPLRRVVDAVHENRVPIFIQLCHGGRKSSPENQGDQKAPSAIPFDDYYGVPVEMTIDDIQKVVKEFSQAARRSVEAGFDGIEIHAAHGYLIHQFLSPISNHRKDEYGGSLENRSRLLKEILSAVRKEVGEDFPVQIRFSADDYAEGGLTAEGIINVLDFLQSGTFDALHVSTGGLLPIRPPHVYPGYQVSYAQKIKEATRVPVIAVGLIHTKELAEEIVMSQQADCIAIGRPFLENPAFVEDWTED